MPGIHSKPQISSSSTPPAPELPSSEPDPVPLDTLYVGERVFLRQPGDRYAGHLGYVVALHPIQASILLVGGFEAEDYDPTRPFDGIIVRRKRIHIFNGIKNAGPALRAEDFPVSHPAPHGYIQAPYPPL